MGDTPAIGGDGPVDAGSDIDLFSGDDPGDPNASTPPPSGGQETPPSDGGEGASGQQAPPGAGDKGEKKEETPEGEKPPVKEGEEKPEEKPEEKGAKGPYDEAFNKHPALRRAFFRDRAFLEVFSSPEEAKEAAERVADFDALEDSLMDGNPEPMFRQMAQNAPEALGGVVENIIPSLAKISGQLAARAALPGLKIVLRTALADAKAAGNQALANSVAWIAKYAKLELEGGDGAPRRPAAADPEVRRLREQNQSMMESRGREFTGSAQASAYGTVDADIKKAITGQPLSDFEKTSLVDRVRAEVIQLLDSDESHNNRMDTLWKRVEREGFPMAKRGDIVHAFLAGARPLLPQVIKKHLAEALKGKQPATPNNGGAPPPGGGRPAGAGANPYDAKRIDFRKTSDEQLFADDITYKQ